MNWNEFLRSDEFRSYRKHQIEQVGMYVERKMKYMVAGIDEPAHVNSEMKGAFEMAKLFIRLPENLTKSDELTDLLKLQEKEDYAALSKFLVMRQML